LRILLLGANGFIGARIGACLIRQGHQVTAGVRPARSFTHGGFSQVLDCDFASLTDLDQWRERVRDHDAVVNCVGILRETSQGSFQQLHVEVPALIFAACEAENVRRVIQLSALGDAHDTRFIGSKHQGDARLEASGLDWTIFRPSVVYSATSSYGGTSLLRAMSAMPVLLLPGSGQQQLQPVDLDELAEAVAGALADHSGIGEVIEAVGPEAISIGDYLQAHRDWLGQSPTLALQTPIWMTSVAAHLGEWLGRGPLGLTMLSMLSQGNVGSPGSVARFKQCLGRLPRSVGATLSRNPASQADLWHARLYLLGPLLRISLGILWVLSGLVGLFTPVEMIQPLLAESGLPIGAGQWLIVLVSLLDLGLGCAFLFAWRVQWAGWLMILMLLGYSVFIGLMLPRFWMEPFGSLIKNIPLLPAILVAMVLDQRR
jgi:uncharacterized protein YbjT (DUF2867 family)